MSYKTNNITCNNIIVDLSWKFHPNWTPDQDPGTCPKVKQLFPVALPTFQPVHFTPYGIEDPGSGTGAKCNQLFIVSWQTYPENLIKICSHTQTDQQTNAGDYIIFLAEVNMKW